MNSWRCSCDTCAREVPLMPIGDEQIPAAWKLVHELRSKGLAVEMAYKGNTGKRMKQADKLGASYAVMLGEDEIATGQYTLKDMKKGEEKKVSADALANALGG